MPDLHEAVPAWAVGIAYAAAVFIAGAAAFGIGRRTREVSSLETPPEFVLNTAFTIVALMMAFSFSMALSHFDARTNAVVRESDAIAVVADRSDVLDAGARKAIRSALRDYAAARVADLDPVTDTAGSRRASSQSQVLQSRMWRIAVDAAKREPQSSTLPLLLLALNELSAAREDEESVRAAHVPEAVVFMLATISWVAIGLMGFRSGRLGESALIGCAILTVILALSVGMIIDLDHPGRELIRVGLDPLRAALRSIAP